MLAKVVDDIQRDWCERLPAVMAAYRASTHESTGFSPNFLMFGHENRLPIDLVFGSPDEGEERSPTYDEYVEGQKNRFQDAYQMVRRNLGAAAARRKERYDTG